MFKHSSENYQNSSLNVNNQFLKCIDIIISITRGVIKIWAVFVEREVSYSNVNKK
jgi:hypothetical protein